MHVIGFVEARGGWLGILRLEEGAVGNFEAGGGCGCEIEMMCDRNIEGRSG